MKRFLVFCAIFLQQFCLFGQDEDTIPAILDVVKTFYSRYSTDSLAYPRVFFEKRPEGWFVITKKIIDNKVIDDQHILFYNFLLKKFSLLDFPESNKEITDPSEYIDPFDRLFFDVYPYYGYTGWYKDVIKELEHKKGMTDRELYALARSYSTLASSLLSDQLGFAIPEESFNPPLKPECLTQAEIKKYKMICEKAIALFGELKKQNPLFETTVGNIAIKYANEIMVPFHCLMVYASEYAKDIKLPDDIYPDSIIENVKKWMNSCPENSIFLSFGDNDFYPILYLQQHDKFRRDIYVINYSLLGMARYINAYSRSLFGAKAVGFCVDSTIYTKENNYYLYLRKSEKVFDVDQIFAKMRTMKYKELPELEGNTFSICLKRNGQIKPSLKLTIEEGYIAMNQWILIDILNHLGDRPVILPNNFNDQLKSLNTYLDWNGTVLSYSNF